jgi:hypothetical protein
MLQAMLGHSLDVALGDPGATVAVVGPALAAGALRRSS